MATLWILDGYNFIRCSRGFAEWEAQAPEEGKRGALEWLGRFCKRTGEQLCIVFDAYSGLNRNPVRKSQFGVQIMESRGGYTADEEIIALAKEKGPGAVVVSSDREILREAVRAGSSILTSIEFEREVEKILNAEAAEEERENREHRQKGMAFRPPKEKKKAFHILRKYQ